MIDIRAQKNRGHRPGHSNVTFLKLLSTVVCLLLCPLSPAVAAPPNNVQVTYDIYKGSMQVGRIDETYTRTDNHYTLVSTTRAVGLLALFNPGKIIINSNGLINTKGLQPLSFKHQRGRDEHKDRAAEFDWNAGQLTLIQHLQRTPVGLPAGTQDRLSAMYQFMFLELQPDTALDFPMTIGSKLDNYHYAITVGPTLKTPAGEFNTLYLDNQPKTGESRTEIWLATQQHNLPCKMTITEADGDSLSQVLRKLEIK